MITDTRRLLSASPQVERFYSKTKISTERFWQGTPCWEWQAGQFKDGYGKFYLRGKTKYANRVSLEIATGRELDELLALHHCDNPPCCNPDHLYAGTHQDNAADRNARNRTSPHISKWRKSNPDCIRKGESHWNAELTAGKVRLIRALADLPQYPQKLLAEIFGVSKALICLIVNRKRWTDI